MYIATNRFRVQPQYQNMFKERWINRTVHIRNVPGFISFQFIEGALHDYSENNGTNEEKTQETYRSYISHTIWESEAAFTDWTRSAQYHVAHTPAREKNVSNTEWRDKIFTGRPIFEGFSVLQSVFPERNSPEEHFADTPGYLATNRFLVTHGEEREFEKRWANSSPYIASAPGFASFQFLKESVSTRTVARIRELDRHQGQEAESTAYISESFWKSEADFLAWTESQIFKEAHALIGTRRNVTLRPAIFEGGNVLQVITNTP